MTFTLLESTILLCYTQPSAQAQQAYHAIPIYFVCIKRLWRMDQGTFIEIDLRLSAEESGGTIVESRKQTIYRPAHWLATRASNDGTGGTIIRPKAASWSSISWV